MALFLIVGAAFTYAWHGYTFHRLQTHFHQNFKAAGVMENSPAALFAYSRLETCIYINHTCLGDALRAIEHSTYSEEDKVQARRLIYSFYGNPH